MLSIVAVIVVVTEIEINGIAIVNMKTEQTISVGKNVGFRMLWIPNLGFKV